VSDGIALGLVDGPTDEVKLGVAEGLELGVELGLEDGSTDGVKLGVAEGL
jgi:hypothetical protein